jgi:hypothetical protein
VHARADVAPDEPGVHGRCRGARGERVGAEVDPLLLGAGHLALALHHVGPLVTVEVCHEGTCTLAPTGQRRLVRPGPQPQRATFSVCSFTGPARPTIAAAGGK